MIIESAFLKLPELLLGTSTTAKAYEATIVSHLAMAAFQELAVRNIQMPMQRIHLECPYPKTHLPKEPGRSDLFVNLAGLFQIGHWHHLYGMKANNWLEAKYFAGIGRQKGAQTTTIHAAVIARDLLRLCLFVQEELSSHRDNGRYFVVVFNREPSKYLALKRQNTTERRIWLEELLSSGEKHIQIDLHRETEGFRKEFFKNSCSQDNNLVIKLRVVVRDFAPIKTVSEFLYWGYLVRIVDFEVRGYDTTLVYEDTSNATWTSEQAEAQRKMVTRFSNDRSRLPRKANIYPEITTE